MNTDEKLYKLLGFESKPSNIDLEKAILEAMETYKTNVDLAAFYENVYAHFFDVTESFVTEPEEPEEPVKTTALLYTPGKLNPLLKETYTRTISIDSQYREFTYPSSTDFTFNLTETLKDVVSLKLYAVQIPYTWYTISRAYGANFFYLKPIETNQSILGHNYLVKIPAGNYTKLTLSKTISDQMNALSSIYTDVSFGSTNFVYNENQSTATITIDIQKRYNESYYKLNIGNTLSKALSFDRSYDLWTCKGATYSTLPTTEFTIDATNDTLYIYRYPFDSDISFETIVIKLTQTTYTDHMALLSSINASLRNHPQLVDSYVRLQSESKYFFLWKIKLNRFTTIPPPLYAKAELVVPDNSIFMRQSSPYLFAFESTRNVLDTIIVSTPSVPISPFRDSLSFVPVYDICGGVYMTQRDNDIVIDVSFNGSTYQSLVDLLNRQLKNNPLTQQSVFSRTDSITTFRYTIDKTYTTKDYKLVFFDLENFTKCTVSSSFKSASIDNTLGWILGFRQLIEYPLQVGYQIMVNDEPFYLNPDTMLSTGSEFQCLENAVKLTGDTAINVNTTATATILLNDYNQNHLNDGLVTITRRDNSVSLPSYANRSQYQCNPITGEKMYLSPNLNQNQNYSVQQIIQTQNLSTANYNSGPFIKDMFAIVPIKQGNAGDILVEFGGTLQIQARLYFGPVNIRRLSIQLINEKGDVMDLNGANWSLQLICEQLYQHP